MRAADVLEAARAAGSARRLVLEQLEVVADSPLRWQIRTCAPGTPVICST